MNKKFHLFHIVEMRPWPLLASLGVWILTLSIVVWLQYKNMFIVFFILIILIFLSFSWWKDVVRESLNQGFHYLDVIDGLKIGIILFIISEVFFFVSFFWGYFHRSVSPTIEIGQNWPPYWINSFDPINVPLLNTIILLSSGVSITWRHHRLIIDNKSKANFSLIVTIFLGLYFSILQLLEYYQSEFNISDCVYGSVFFIATGFHGLHVFIGTSFLIVTFIRLHNINNNSNHLIGFEAAAWYWHFVDVVWLFLYLSIYWWGK